jgi:hypothetical protein
MSTSSRISRDDVLEWLKGGGLLVVTITGLFLYVILSIPAVIFYGRFGVGVDEVGINYISLLSGSTVEVMAFLIVLTFAFLAVAFLVAYMSFGFRAAVISQRGWLRASPSGVKVWELDDEEFDEAIERFKKASSYLPEIRELINPGFPDLSAWEAAQRRRRELRRMSTRTETQSAELTSIEQNFKAAPGVYDLSLLITKSWIRRRGRGLAISFLFVATVIGLPVLAYVQAGQVLGGKEFLGAKAEILDYHAEIVTVSPAVTTASRAVRELEGRHVFLLGQNAQYAILYSPTMRVAIRVPIVDVVIIGTSS